MPQLAGTPRSAAMHSVSSGRGGGGSGLSGRRPPLPAIEMHGLTCTMPRYNWVVQSYAQGMNQGKKYAGLGSRA